MADLSQDWFDDVGVTGALVEFVLVEEYIEIYLGELFIPAQAETISIEEYVLILDIVIELLASDQIGVAEDITVDALIEGLFVDSVTILEYNNMYYGIQLETVEVIGVTEAIDALVLYWDLYPVFCTIIPRKRMFTSIRECSQGGNLPMSTPITTKRPTEKYPVGVIYEAPDIEEGETIVSTEVAIFPDEEGGLKKYGAAVIEDDRVSQMVEGGIDGNSYYVKFTTVTSVNHIYVDAIYVQVRQIEGE